MKINDFESNIDSKPSLNEENRKEKIKINL